MTVLAANPQNRTNAALMLDAKALGYLSDEMVILDPTYGRGGMWKFWRPNGLVAGDIDPQEFGQIRLDFTRMPFEDDSFDAVVFDPPYKLNGTPTSGDMDRRYGVHTTRRWQDRMELVKLGLTECIRVLRPKGHLLLKCQDQVCSGQVRWQTREFADFVEKESNLRLVDHLLLLGGRPQPEGRKQVHARRNHSSLLIFGGGK